MTSLLKPEEFEELEGLADVLLARARQFCAGVTYAPEGATPEERALREEMNALQLSITAVAKRTGMNDVALMVALGSNMGVMLAQCRGNHAEIWKAVREAVKSTYDEITDFGKPSSGAIN